MAVSTFLKSRVETSKSHLFCAPVLLCIPTDPRRDRNGTEYLADVGQGRETASRLSVRSVSPENRTVRPQDLPIIRMADANRPHELRKRACDILHAYTGDL